MLPCQHCIIEQQKIKQRRARRKHQRCYYCKELGHFIAYCPVKEDNEAQELINQSLSVGTRRQANIEDHHEDILVAGSDTGLWENVWYISHNIKHHISGNPSLFSCMLSSYGIETHVQEVGKTFIKGLGSTSVETEQETLYIQNVFYVPGYDKNVLSYDQLILQGYVVKIEGLAGRIFQIFKGPNLVNNNPNIVDRYKGKGHIMNKNEKDQDYVDRCKKDYQDFLRLEKGKFIKENDGRSLEKYMENISLDHEKFNWNKAIIHALEFRSFDDCIALISLIDDPEFVNQYKDLLRIKFETMIHWFLNDHLSLNRLVPPYNNQNKRVELLDLYIVVKREGGQKRVDNKGLWAMVAKDIGFEWYEGYVIKLIYARYLDVFEFEHRLYMNKEETSKNNEEKEDPSNPQDAESRTGDTPNLTNAREDIDKKLKDSHEYALFMGNDWIGAKERFKKRQDEDKHIWFKKRKINFDAAKSALDEAFHTQPKNKTSLKPNYV